MAIWIAGMQRMMKEIHHKRMLEIAHGYDRCAITTVNDAECGFVCAHGMLCHYGRDTWTAVEEIEFWNKIIDLINKTESV